MEKALVWSASAVVTVAVGIAFLFMTFQTAADADKLNGYFDARLDRISNKIGKLEDKIDKLQESLTSYIKRESALEGENDSDYVSSIIDRQKLHKGLISDRFR